MDEAYLSKSVEEVMSGLNVETLKKYIPASKLGVSPSVATIDFLLETLGIDKKSVKNPELLIRNYIYATTMARGHLLKINEIQRNIEKQLKKSNDKESYSHKKLQYFHNNCQSAKDQIINFISSEIGTYVWKQSSDLMDRDREAEGIWFLGSTYDYQYNARFYDPNFDFSTYVKFCYIPGISFIEALKNIEKYIQLKQSSMDDYYAEVIRVVNEHDMVSYMGNRVGGNYHIHARKEIFDTMTTLFNEGKYLAFISMATIQLEGIFYELVCIKFGRKERQGTLVEKVERAFRSNRQMMQTLYPYFAFDIPELRNEIAHKGIVEERDLKKTAYELVLDLNCVLYLTESASTDKFKQFLIIADKLSEIERQKYDKQGDYENAVARQLIGELYMSTIISMDYFWEVLIAPAEFDDEMEYYLPENLQEDEIYLKDVVYAIVEWTRKEAFWGAILEELDEMFVTKTVNTELLNLFTDLKKRLIGLLKGEAKIKCCMVNAKIEQIKAIEKGSE